MFWNWKVKSADKAIKLGEGAILDPEQFDNIRLQFPTKLQRFYFFPKKFKDHSEGQNATKGEQSKEFLRQPNIRAMQLFAKSTDTISLEYQLSITKLWFISSGKVKNVIIDFLRNTCYNLLNINYLSSNSDLHQALWRLISCRYFCKKFKSASKI